MFLKCKKIIKIMALLTLSVHMFFGINCSTAFAYNPNNEIRAVWIATVANSDWPKSLGKESQKQEMIENLDQLQKTGINRVYFQVRCRADAMYPSENWPWSQWLTGELGKDPEYDPLLFMKEECKKRNITLEAWINPFFVRSGENFDLNSYLEKLPNGNPLKYHPEWVVKNENNWFMLNPGIPEVREIVIKEALYIAQKYQLGIHIDDFFYPYPKNKNQVITFDDEQQYKLYGCGLSRDDFRRENINKFMESLYKGIKDINPNLTFSVSPFAIWKNSVEDGGCGTDGLESFHKIYTDTVQWIKKGWIDYVIPQIYWHIGFKIADYEALANWWNNVVDGTNVKLIIGQAGYRLNPDAKTEAFRSTDEIIKQINLNRSLKNVAGQSIFSLACIKDNVLDISEKLSEVYK